MTLIREDIWKIWSEFSFILPLYNQKWRLAILYQITNLDYAVKIFWAIKCIMGAMIPIKNLVFLNLVQSLDNSFNFVDNLDSFYSYWLFSY